MSRGLDFGAGSGPVITKVLQDNFYNILSYDPYFHNYPELLEKRYDYIACCEVVEHFYNPNKEFYLFKKLLKKDAKLYLMTELYDEKIEFESWYYKNDPTHIFFYSRATFEWIQKKFDFLDVTFNHRLITITNL